MTTQLGSLSTKRTLFRDGGLLMADALLIPKVTLQELWMYPNVTGDFLGGQDRCGGYWLLNEQPLKRFIVQQLRSLAISYLAAFL